MKLVHLSDIHLGRPGEAVGGRDPRANFEAALAEIARLHADAALVVLNGDLCETAAAESYRWLADRLAESGLRTALTIGNHDDRTLFGAAFPEALDEAGDAQSVHALPVGRAILLDTVADEPLIGRLGPRRLAWLDARLAEQAGPHWIFLHHNPIPTGLLPLDRIMLEDAAELTAICRRHRERIAHILHGHTHLPMSGSLAGVPVASGRGTNHAGYPHFGQDGLLPLSDLPEAYSVILAGPEATTVMMVEFGYQRHAGQPAPVP